MSEASSRLCTSAATRRAPHREVYSYKPRINRRRDYVIEFVEMGTRCGVRYCPNVPQRLSNEPDGTAGAAPLMVPPLLVERSPTALASCEAGAWAGTGA